MMDHAVSVLLTAWLLATAAKALPGGEERFAKLGHVIVGLLPTWNFFAPTPGMHDFVLLFRDESSVGAVGPWLETEVGRAEPRPWISAAWNPSKFGRKALFDLTVEVAKRSLDEEPAAVSLSVPYLLLLNHVCSLPRALGSQRRRQFMVASLEGVGGRLEPVFVSALHNFDDDAAN